MHTMSLRHMQVRVESSPTRLLVLRLASAFQKDHPELEMIIGGPRLDSHQYRGILLGSKFTLVPRGLHPGTFRLYECLESG